MAVSPSGESAMRCARRSARSSSASSVSGMSIWPWKSSRSATPTQLRRSTSGRGFVHFSEKWYLRFTLDVRDILDPVVVTKMTVAPLRCRSALVAVVVPMLIASSAPRWSSLGDGVHDRVDGRDGVDGVLATTNSPVTSSIPIRSVKVPPVSIPRLTAIYALPE